MNTNCVVLIFIGLLLLLLCNSLTSDFHSLLHELVDTHNSNKDFINDYINFIEKYRNNDLKVDELTDNNELIKRYNKFTENMIWINELNNDENNPNRGGYGITKFMDWFDEEMEAMYSNNNNANMEQFGQQQKNSNDNNYYNIHDNINNNIQSDIILPDLNKVIDYFHRSADCWEHPVWHDVNVQSMYNPWGLTKCQKCADQRQANMCWAFASTLSFECNACKQKGKCVDFQEQYVIDCSIVWPYFTQPEGCNQGGLPGRAIALYRDLGACINYEYYFDPFGRCNLCDLQKCTERFRSDGCFWLNDEAQRDPLTVTSLANQYALAFGMNVSSDFGFWTGEQEYKYCDYSKGKGTHAMTIIGQRYGNSLLLQNSWGCGWGNQGTTWIAADIVNKQISNCELTQRFSFNVWNNRIDQ